MTYNIISNIAVGILSIWIFTVIQKISKNNNDGWNPYPDIKPNKRSWYLVTMIEKSWLNRDEYITYTTTMYYLGDGNWVNITVQHLLEKYDFVKGGENNSRIYNTDILNEYTFKDTDDNDNGRCIIAWREMKNVYISNSINYYDESNMCDICPDVYKRNMHK